jgi:hypothetical protein
MDPAVRDLMDLAIEDVADYQSRFIREPGAPQQVSLGGVQHALIPASIFARDLPSVLARSDAPEVVALVLYELGSLIGTTHARGFFGYRDIPESHRLYRVLTGPSHFAWAGYGDVDLLLVGETGTLENVFLWESSTSFSAAERTPTGRRARSCHMQAGYASGWVSDAMGMAMRATELACRTEGADRCRFVLCEDGRTGDVIADERLHQPRSHYPTLRAHARPSE